MEQLRETECSKVMSMLQSKVLELGAYKAGVIEVAEISTDAAFRRMCESNACGNYGRNYTCPPDIGPIDELMAKVKSFDKALVYQTVGQLEDSYDFEGMMEAGEKHNELVLQLGDYIDALSKESLIDEGSVLHLAAGGCRLCSVCGKRTGEPCRHPKRAMASLEAHGINVSQLADQAGMRYINGQNTVTYFGAVFYR